jgi:hypothetical protein
LAEIASGLRKLLDSIEAGEMAASTATVRRLEGAWLALTSLGSGGTLDLGDLVDDDSTD